MQSFIEKRFPIDIAYAAAGGPEFSTDVLLTSGGHEQRNINWVHARCRYEVASAITTTRQLEELIAMFRVCKGKAIGFRFKDFADYQAQQELIGSGDGKTKEFQLTKTYTFAEQKYIRAIYKPVEGSVKVYLEEQPIDFECNYQNGLITLKAIPEENQELRASFEFDVPVRFDTDRLTTNLEDYAKFNAMQVPLIEIKSYSQ